MSGMRSNPQGILMKQVVDVWNVLHLASEYNNKYSEAKFVCDQIPPISEYKKLYSWSRAFVPSVNCTIQVKSRLKMKFSIMKTLGVHSSCIACFRNKT